MWRDVFQIWKSAKYSKSLQNSSVLGSDLNELLVYQSTFGKLKSLVSIRFDKPVLDYLSRNCLQLLSQIDESKVGDHIKVANTTKFSNLTETKFL